MLHERKIKQNVISVLKYFLNKLNIDNLNFDRKKLLIKQTKHCGSKKEITFKVDILIPSEAQPFGLF